MSNISIVAPAGSGEGNQGHHNNVQIFLMRGNSSKLSNNQTECAVKR